MSTLAIILAAAGAVALALGVGLASWARRQLRTLAAAAAANKTAPPKPEPAAGPTVASPQWIHETLTVKLGAGAYQFRTLSLYDVFTLWPHLAQLHTLALADRYLSMIEQAIPVLKWLAPDLITREADCAALANDPKTIGLILDFYRRQDWQRMEQLGTETAGGDEKPEGEELSPHQKFLVVCAAGARYAGMDVGQFVRERFEFCADQIVMAYRMLEAADPEATAKPKTWAETLSVLGSPRVVAADQAPAWIEKLERPN